MAKRKTHDDLYPDSVGRFRDLVPQGTKHFQRVNYTLTDFAQDMLLDLIQSGEHIYVAAQIAGVERGTLSVWLRKGRECTDETSVYYRFFTRYKHARLRGLKLLREKQERRKADPQGYGDLPVNTAENSLPHALFTQENVEAILFNISTGMFPGVASEAAGVPAQVLVFWTTQGKQDMQYGRTSSDFYRFYIDYIKTAAQARGKAEVRVYKDMPLAYLLHGPGKETAEMPGWSKTNVIVGAGGGPVQIETSWKVAQQPQQPQQQIGTIEGSVREIAAPTQDLTEDNI